MPGENLTLKAGEKAELKVAPNMQMPVTLNCDIHKWMAGYVWVLDTPYAAVTKEDGSFEIKGVPAGTKLNLVVWHEGGLRQGRREGQHDRCQGRRKQPRHDQDQGEVIANRDNFTRRATRIRSGRPGVFVARRCGLSPVAVRGKGGRRLKCLRGDSP